MFIPPHNELLPPQLPRPERSPGQSASGSATSVSASLMPTERQSVNGVEVLHAGSKLGPNYPNVPHARIYHPKQSPSAISSENFLQARAALNPGFMHHAAQTNIARVSNLYRDVPQFKNELDILVWLTNKLIDQIVCTPWGLNQHINQAPFLRRCQRYHLRGGTSQNLLFGQARCFTGRIRVKNTATGNLRLDQHPW